MKYFALIVLIMMAFPLVYSQSRPLVASIDDMDKYIDGILLAKDRYDKKVAEIGANNAIEEWETDNDFAQRKSKIIGIEANTEKMKYEEAVALLAKSKYQKHIDNVDITSMEYNKHERKWHFSASLKSKTIDLIVFFYISIANSTDIGESYYRIKNAVTNGRLCAECFFEVEFNVGLKIKNLILKVMDGDNDLSDKLVIINNTVTLVKNNDKFKQNFETNNQEWLNGTSRPRIYKGKDEGNNWELNTDREGVGFNLSPDLAEKMPIPHKIPAGLMDRDKTSTVRQDGRWGTLEASYKADSYGDWVYNGRLATTNERSEIWQLLRKLGYDVSRADYLFRIRGPARFIITLGPAGGKPARVELDGSSERGGSCGAPDVDEALRQGLLQTGFSNNSGKGAVVRFTYSFYKLQAAQ